MKFKNDINTNLKEYIYIFYKDLKNMKKIDIL